MLGHFRTLDTHRYIPQLVHQGETKITNSTTKNKTKLQIYKLDWSTADATKLKKIREWVRPFDGTLYAAVQDLDLIVPGLAATLPAEFEMLVRDMVFAVSQSYLTEINYFTQLFVADRSRPRPFDTIIRDHCLDVSNSAINCAFGLLADCMMVGDSWLRSVSANGVELDKWMIECLIKFKFWKGFTGDGLVWDHAGLDRMERHTDLGMRVNAKTHQPYEDRQLNIMKMLNRMREWTKFQDVTREALAARMGPVQMPPTRTFRTGYGYKVEIQDVPAPPANELGDQNPRVPDDL